MQISAKIDCLGHQTSGLTGRIYTFIKRLPHAKRLLTDSGPSIAAIGISAPVDRLSEARCKKVVLEVKRAAAEISAKLGCST
jgi:hypothetical protein